MRDVHGLILFEQANEISLKETWRLTSFTTSGPYFDYSIGRPLSAVPCSNVADFTLFGSTVSPSLYILLFLISSLFLCDSPDSIVYCCLGQRGSSRCGVSPFYSGISTYFTIRPRSVHCPPVLSLSAIPSSTYTITVHSAMQRLRPIIVGRRSAGTRSSNKVPMTADVGVSCVAGNQPFRQFRRA